MQPQGWFRDPYGTHDDRWFSDGTPTNLVRDQGLESYDDPTREQLPPSARSRPARQELQSPWSGRAGTQLRSWSVWLPALLALVPLGIFWWAPGIILLAVPIIVLAWMGVRVPEWRLAIVVILWVAFVLSCICVPLLASMIANSINSSWT